MGTLAPLGGLLNVGLLGDSGSLDRVQEALHVRALHEITLDEQKLARDEHIVRLNEANDRVTDATARSIGSVLIPYVDRFILATPAIGVSSNRQRSSEWARNVVGSLRVVSGQRDVGEIAIRTELPEVFKDFQMQTELFRDCAERLHKTGKKMGVPLTSPVEPSFLPFTHDYDPVERIAGWSADVVSRAGEEPALLVLVDRASYEDVLTENNAVLGFAGRLAVGRVNGDATLLMTDIQHGKPTWSAYS